MNSWNYERINLSWRGSEPVCDFSRREFLCTNRSLWTSNILYTIIGSIWDNDSSKRKALNWRISTKNCFFLECKHQKTNAFIMSSPSFEDEWSSSLAFIAGHDIIWYGISLWSVWVSFCPLLTFCLLPAYWPLGSVGFGETPLMCGSSASSSQNWCLISTLLATKHNTTRAAAMRKLIPYQPDLTQSLCLIPYNLHHIQAPQNSIHLYML